MHTGTSWLKDLILRRRGPKFQNYGSLILVACEFFKEILDQLNQGRVAKMAQLEEEIKLQESVEPMLKVGKDVFEILRVCM